MSLKILSGKWKGRFLKTPPSRITRPTQSLVRAALFNMCQMEIEGARFLDLFSGSGAMGLEALSRGASSVILVESSRTAASVIRKNIQELEAEAEVFEADAKRAVEVFAKKKQQFDLIYLDPPYGRGEIGEILLEIEPILAPGGRLFLEESKRNEGIFSLTRLKHHKSRIFGETVLHEFH